MNLRPSFFRGVVRSWRVNAKPYAGMNRHSLAGCRGYLFRLDIKCLPDLAEAARLQPPVAGDVGGDLEFLPVSIRLDARVKVSRGSAHLDVERP